MFGYAAIVIAMLAANDAAGQVAGPATATSASSASTPPARIVHFPKDRSLGDLSVQDEVKDQPIVSFYDWIRQNDEWIGLGQAKGDVAVPAGMRLRLAVPDTAAEGLSALRQLRPDDLYELRVAAQLIGDGFRPAGPLRRVDMESIGHLTGLKVLVLSEAKGVDLRPLRVMGLKSLESLSLTNFMDRSADLSDGNLAIVGQLTSLKRLSFGGSQMTDKGLTYLANLRGLEELSLCRANVTPGGLTQLSRLPALHYLLLWSEKLNDDWLIPVRRIRSLKTLNLGHQAVTDAGLRNLSGHEGLEALALYHADNITNAGMAHLKGLRSLKKLDLMHTHVGDAGARQLKEIKTLEELDLPDGGGRKPYAGLTDVGLADLSELSNLRCLRWHTIMSSKDESVECPVSDVGLAHLAKLQHVEELTIAGTGITDEGMGTIAGLTGLKRLSLTCPKVTSAGLAKLSQLKRLNSLQIGHPYRNAMTTAGLVQLNGLSELRKLTVEYLVRDEAPLDISGMTHLETLTVSVNSKGPALRDEDIACLSGLTHLRRLQLPTSDFSDAGIAKLAGLTEMDFLNVGGSPRMTDKGLMYLAGMRRLNALYISGSFTDAAVPLLAQMQSLRSLDLKTRTRMSPAALDRLRAALPEARVNVNGPPEAAAPVASANRVF